jgi:virulence factor Mce-like protein
VRLNKFSRLLAAVVVAALGVAAVIGLVHVLTGTHDRYTVTAQFPATPGLYPHNSVDILGVPTGEIESVTPRDDHVDVVLSLPDHVALPQNVHALLVARNPVSDRSVELDPAYTGGPELARGATIPLSRTAVPLELDDVYASVDDLAKALGPAGANKGGELSAALHALAQLADGNGQDAHNAITAIASALPALTEHPEQLRHLITGLDRLTALLATRNSTIDSLYGDLADATGELSDERGTLAAAITNLQHGLATVSTFIRNNEDELGAGVHNLNTAVAEIAAQQRALIDTFDTAPLAFQNYNRAIDTAAPCPGASGACPALFSRLDFTRDAAQIVRTYCGDTVLASMLPILQYSVTKSGATPKDTLCSAEIGLLQGRDGAPNAPASPDLDLAHHLGSR